MKNQSIIKEQRMLFYLILLGLTVVVFISIFTGCKKEPAYKDAVLITGAETTNVINFSVDGAPSQIALTASSTGLVNQDIDVSFNVDTGLLKSYNAANQTNFYSLPAGSYTLSANSAIIKAGGNVSDAVSITVTSTAKLVTGRNYMIPVTIGIIKGNLKVLKSSGTAFIKVNQVITTSVADITPGPYFTTNFTKNVALNAFTLEFRVKVSQFASVFHISRVCDFSGTTASGGTDFDVIRFGELSDAINQLQWINSAGKISSKTLFATNTWYSVSLVFDGSTCSMYVNGNLDGSFPATGYTFYFNQFTLGFSGQDLAGDISELRLWSKALTAGEIQNGFCGVDPASTGLLAYWKLNEGTGNSVTDYSGHGYTLLAPNDFTWVKGVKCPN